MGTGFHWYASWEFQRGRLIIIVCFLVHIHMNIAGLSIFLNYIFHRSSVLSMRLEAFPLLKVVKVTSMSICVMVTIPTTTTAVSTSIFRIQPCLLLENLPVYSSSIRRLQQQELVDHVGENHIPSEGFSQQTPTLCLEWEMGNFIHLPWILEAQARIIKDWRSVGPSK